MSFCYADLQPWAEQWKAEGKTPEEAAALAAAKDAAMVVIAMTLCHVFELPLGAAISAANPAIQREENPGQP